MGPALFAFSRTVTAAPPRRDPGTCPHRAHRPAARPLTDAHRTHRSRHSRNVPVEPPRPLLEIGREQYTSGLYDESSTLLGGLNPLLPGLSIYGDWRTAVADYQVPYTTATLANLHQDAAALSSKVETVRAALGRSVTVPFFRWAAST